MAAGLQIQRSMKLRLSPILPLLALALELGCTPRHRVQTLGSASMSRGNASVAVDGSPDSLQAEVSIYLPRAMEVEMTLHCPGNAPFSQRLGEPWEHYRERRVAEIKREREEARRREAAAINAIAGQLGGRVETEAGTVDVKVEASAEVEAAPTIQLPPGDVGAREYKRSTTLRGGSAGQCILKLAAVDGSPPPMGTRGLLAVKRIVDTKRVARKARLEAMQRDLDLRAEVRANLKSTGADPNFRARIAAEKKAEEQAQVTLKLNAELSARRRDLMLRRRIVTALIAVGADPNRKARMAAEARTKASKERLALRARAQADLARRQRLKAENDDKRNCTQKQRLA
jgi:hypothetical protein